VEGCKIAIEEKRADNIGFRKEHQIERSVLRIRLPYFPDVVEMRIIDKQGDLIDYSYVAWGTIEVNMHIQDRVVDYRVENAGGEEIFSVAKTVAGATSTIGNYDRQAVDYLRAARAERHFEELEKDHGFIFFPKEADSKLKAQKAVREILNKARFRCMILDPYFSLGDLIYIFHIENVSVPVQIISSAMHLGKKNKRPAEKGNNGFGGLLLQIKKMFSRRHASCQQNFAEMLERGIANYEKAYPAQQIECRILRGGKSPLHDRYIVIDDDVYLLGSSLNEFGNRTTTIVKAPAPKKMIGQAVNWWEDPAICQPIADFIKQTGAINDKKRWTAI
jgi:hypothetical protein